MENRENFEKLQKKYREFSETPYFDNKGIQNVVETFEKFVNQFDTREMFALGIELANGENEHAMEYMKERNLTIPKDQDEAVDRGLDLVGSELASIHRTLVQNFMRVVVSFIQYNAAMYEAGFYDLRNEDTCRLSHAIWSVLKDNPDFFLRMV